MARRLSIRWKLIFTSCAAALGLCVVLGSYFYRHHRASVFGQMEKTLETKCDEVITVLETGGDPLTLEQFLRIETSYRFSPYVYFYQVSDRTGRILARS